MKTRKENLIVLPSVACMIDQETLDTYPCPKGISADASIYFEEPITVIIKGLDVYEDEAVAFENVTDEWLESLSAQDLKKIVYLIRDTSIRIQYED